MYHHLLNTLLLLSQLSHAWAESVVDEVYKPQEVKVQKTCTLTDNGECVNPDAVSQANSSASAESTPTGAMCLDDRDECPQYAKRGDCK